jgi:hypothetical protein
VFYCTLLSAGTETYETQCFIVHCCRQEQKHTKHMSMWEGPLCDSMTIRAREYRIWKDLQGNCDRCLTEVLSRNLPGGTEERQEKPDKTAGVSTEIRTGNLPNVNIGRHCYTNQWIFSFVILTKMRDQFSACKCALPYSCPFQPSLSSYYFRILFRKRWSPLQHEAPLHNPRILPAI